MAALPPAGIPSVALYERSLPLRLSDEGGQDARDWDELIKQQECSGMKPREFCRARGIDPSKFGYQRWCRKGVQKKERFVRVDSGAVTFVEEL